MESYTVLSPWAESDHLVKKPISARIDTLEGKTLGLYVSFKEYHPFFMEELGRQIKELVPSIELSTFEYLVDAKEITEDPDHYPAFAEWVKSVDAVVGVGADMGSCALYMGYIFAAIEDLGCPAVLLAKHQYVNSARKGASARSYPDLRIVTYDGPGFVPAGVDCRTWTIDVYRSVIAEMLDRIIEGLTAPLSVEELNPAPRKDYSHETFTGTIDEINEHFYRRGWTNGTPVVPPTEEAVEEMLRGVDLPRDYVVAELPPMLGKATVEKIAVNGIMAGCLPTYMPVLIAAVEAMADDKLQLEGWTSSNASWQPIVVVNGPIRNALGFNTGRNFLSPYTKPQSSIARAVAYIIMNISGCRSRIEDMSGPGSDGRFGTCIAENEEESPWAPLQTDFGYEAEDSSVLLFWPSEHTQVPVFSPSSTLETLCHVWHGGFDVGMMLTLPPSAARAFADAGYSKQDILDYVVEYNHRPSSQIPRAAIGNNHPRKGLIFPAPGLEHQARLFWNDEHMFILIGGEDWGTCYLGGGDHGGPICRKANLPSAWEALCADYPAYEPEYVDY